MEIKLPIMPKQIAIIKSDEKVTSIKKRQPIILQLSEIIETILIPKLSIYLPIKGIKKTLGNHHNAYVNPAYSMLFVSEYTITGAKKTIKPSAVSTIKSI